MILKPTRRSFFLRYFIFPYYLICGIVMIYLANLEVVKIASADFWKYLGIWLALTMIPSLILSFYRRRFGWFFWTLLMNIIGWTGYFYLQSVEEFEQQLKYESLVMLAKNAPYMIFIVVSLIALVIIELYRVSFKYEISRTNISITYGLFGANKQLIISKNITNVLKKRSVIECMLGIGHVIPVTSSGMGAGDTGVFGGMGAGIGAKNIGAGAFMGKTSTEKEFVANPKNCLYGVANPDKAMNFIAHLLVDENKPPHDISGNSEEDNTISDERNS
ncbi:MAG: PH domain-containing protein [Thermotogota bacterium]|nr:PH domain-containing protein [Thermotogota bacterium]